MLNFNKEFIHSKVVSNSKKNGTEFSSVSILYWPKYGQKKRTSGICMCVFLGLGSPFPCQQPSVYWSLSLLNQKNISVVDSIRLLTSVCFSFVHSATSISSSLSVTSSSTSEPSSMSEFMFSVESSADLQSPLSSPEGDSYFDKKISQCY